MANIPQSCVPTVCTLALLAAAGLTPRATLAQSSEQMEYERQQREYWQAQEQQRQEQQRIQQLQEENARRQQEEAMSAAQAQYDASYEVQSQSAPSYDDSSEVQSSPARSYGGPSAASTTSAAPAVPIPKDPATAAFQRGDYATAARLLRDDALKGDANAQRNLGYLYEEGLGVPRDPAQALAWYQKAADQGYAAAYNDLGAMYANGSGVPQDLVRAYVLFTQAWAKGNGDVVRVAISNRERVRSQMSYAQSSEAVRQEQALRGQ